MPEPESAWLFKIAENVCLSRRRSSWRRGRIESPSDFEIIEEIIPGPSRQNDELIGIEDALASMPEQQRRAILLREWQGLSYREIAEELEVTQSAVETLIFRARRSLAAGLEQPDSVKTPKRKSFRRALHALDLGTVAAAFKALLAGSAAVKATAAAVAVTAAATTAYGVEKKIESKPPVRTAAPAKTLVSKSATCRFRVSAGLFGLQLSSARCSFRTAACGQARSWRSTRPPARLRLRRPRRTRRRCTTSRPESRPSRLRRRRRPRRRSPRRLRLQLPRPSRRSSRAQTRARRTTASGVEPVPRGGRSGRRADRGARARIADEGRARRRYAHGDDLPDARARGHHESGTGSCHERGSGRPDSGRHDVEHDDGSARARPRHELGERGEQIDRDAVGVLQLRVPLSPERVPRLLLAVEPRCGDARVDLVHLRGALALERE